MRGCLPGYSIGRLAPSQWDLETLVPMDLSEDGRGGNYLLTPLSEVSEEALGFRGSPNPYLYVLQSCGQS